MILSILELKILEKFDNKQGWGGREGGGEGMVREIKDKAKPRFALFLPDL